MTESDLIAIFERRGYICVRTIQSYHAIPATDVVRGQIKQDARSVVEVSTFILPEAAKQDIEQFFDRALAGSQYNNVFDINQQHTILSGKKPEVPDWKGWDTEKLLKILSPEQ